MIEPTPSNMRRKSADVLPTIPCGQPLKEGIGKSATAAAAATVEDPSVESQLSDAVRWAGIQTLFEASLSIWRRFFQESTG